MNLTELLAKLSSLDDAAEAIDFDPALVVGDVRDKVDAIHTVLGRLGAERDRLQADAAHITKAASQIEANRLRLTQYLKWAMLSHGFQKLPGVKWRAQLQRSAPALIVDREANADDCIASPALVKRDVRYTWDKTAVKEYIEQGGKFDHGHVVQPEYVRFYVNKGQES